MKIVSTIARILLGIMFVVMGINGFLLFMPPPPVLPELMTQFSTAMFASHYMWMTSGVQVICGVLLLFNRYMLLTIVVLAAVLVNIITLHITMYPQGLPMAFVAVILWFLAAWPLRAQFAPLFAAKVSS
jgi:putative oxidoreductase